jgi:hypothetical protein
MSAPLVNSGGRNRRSHVVSLSASGVSIQAGEAMLREVDKQVADLTARLGFQI